MATVISGVGALLFLIGVLLLLGGVKSRGKIDTDLGKYSGPVWFIFIALGAVMIYLDNLLFH